MRLRVHTVAVLALLAGVPTSTAAASERLATTSVPEIAWTRGFDVMVWDSVNGVRRVSNGVDRSYEPALSSDGRYLVYTTRTARACREIVMLDLWRWRTVPLPGLFDLDRRDCAESPHLSRDGRLLVWAGQAVTPGAVSDLYMYDVVAHRAIPLPRVINSNTAEGSPSLSDDGTRLAFVSARQGISHGLDVLVADISHVRTTGAASLVPTPPGLQSTAEQAAAEMSGDGSTFVWTNGETTADKTFVFDARAGRLLSAPALTRSQDTYSPAVNRDGSVVAVAHTESSGHTGVWLWRRSTGAYAEPRALRSILGDEDPTVSWPALVALPAPRLARSVSASRVSGIVRVKLPGARRFTTLARGAALPVGSLVDAARGRVRITSARGTRGRTQSGEFHGGAFVIRQRRSQHGLTELRLHGGNFTRCGRRAGRAARRAGPRTRGLWGAGKGSFRTGGRFGAATVRGTVWFTQDRCDGTLFRVRRGTVVVRDYVRRRTVTVRRGHAYLARAPRSGRR